MATSLPVPITVIEHDPTKRVNLLNGLELAESTGIVGVNKAVEIGRLTPIIESDLFLKQDSRVNYWIGRVANQGLVERPDELRAAHQLRARVYVDEMGILGQDYVVADGEFDQDDKRSIQLGFAQKGPRDGQATIVGTSRLIVKQDRDDLLPVEKMFPEAFKQSIEDGSVEVSRFIVRHPQKTVQRLLSILNMYALDKEALRIKAPYSYAIIEKPLARLFDKIGVPYVQLSDYKEIPEYGNTWNMAIGVDPAKMEKTMISCLKNLDSLNRFMGNVALAAGQ